MDKLELKHLAPYLPYGLNYQATNQMNGESYISEIEIHDYNLHYYSQDFKPILRPLSDLTKNVFDNTEDVLGVPMRRIALSASKGKTDVFHEALPLEFYVEWYDKNNVSKSINLNYQCKYADWWVMEYLFGWHFDVFGLIEKGLAISVHDVKQ